jgi:Flp pilus assembly protein TadG
MVKSAKAVCASEIRIMSIGERVRGTLGRLRTLLRNNRANVSMMFAIAIIPLTIAAGAGLDLARAMIVKTNLSEALDATALAVASNSALTDQTRQAYAQAYFNANYEVNPAYGSAAVLGKIAPMDGTGSTSVTVTTNVAMPTTLMGVVGIHSVNVGASSTVVWGQNKLWVSLVLDNTGSMTDKDNTGTTKISALVTATHQLLGLLKNASPNVGDVRAAIIPFSKTVNVGTANAGATWIDWTDWDGPPPNGTPSTNIGPGSSCPYSTSDEGYRCTSGPSNGASTVSTIPSSGLICPGVASADASTGLGGHYYNGCYNSTPGKTQVTTKVATTPTTQSQNCSQTGSGAVSCTNSGSSHTGSTTSSSSTATVTGYTGDSGPTTTNTSSTSNSDGRSSCSGSGSKQKCTWTRTVTTNAIATTVTKVGAGPPWAHAWVANDHSSWDGCIMDRTQDYDTNATSPTGTSTRFPAEDTQSCVPSVLGALSTDWTALNAQVDAMTAVGSTNQTIGLAWGMQALATGDPLNAPTLPANTKQYIIILSDGLNTQNRWSGDGSNQETDVDNRMALACSNAKAAGMTIYAIFVDLNGTQGNSDVLQKCASDPSMYFDLQSSGAIITTLNAIGEAITNLRVAL